jgi:hypothetical protein
MTMRSRFPGRWIPTRPARSHDDARTVRPVIVEPMPDVLRPLFDQVVIKELDPERLLVCRVRELLGVIEGGPSPR